MIVVTPKHRIFLAIEPINFRKGIDGIAAFCHQHFLHDPMSGHYYMFRNKRKTSIKILYFDGQGYCLFQKRLSAGKFRQWPSCPDELVQLTSAQLHVLLFNGNPAEVVTEAPWKPIDH